jgi:hypothetical protein
MKCPECEIDYPEEYLNPLFIGTSATKPICAICALEWRNEHHGMPKNTPFTGTRAQELYEMAVKHRKKTGVRP